MSVCTSDVENGIGYFFSSYCTVERYVPREKKALFLFALLQTLLIAPTPTALASSRKDNSDLTYLRTSIILCCVRRPVSEAPRKIYRVTKILLKGTDLCRRQRLFNVSTNCHADWQPTNELHRLPVGHSYFSTQSLN
jgi:hypothetical protein